MGGDSAEPLFRSLPSVDRVLRTDPIAGLTNGQSPAAVARVVRRVLEESRVCIRQGKEAPTLERIVAAVAERVAGWEPHPRRVINATGVILHTNLGRAPLSSDALQAIVGASAYSDLEYDLEDGRRGSRQQHVRLLLQALLDAEASHVTVNSASAVLLMLTALVKGREVIVSRGQAVEIGGGFRIPEILRQSGALLVEVGTTNRTRLADYVEAVSDRTGAILHVHPSNFHVVGFTEEASLAELASLAGDRNVLLLSDNGSGALYDTVRFGLVHEPMPAEALAAGADVVAFSGDKLLGGPQAGILVGRAEQLRRIDKHPLARALRPDKSTFAALSATLLAYLRDDALSTLPLWQMISQTQDNIRARAHVWLRAAEGRGLDASLEDGESVVGGGSLPGQSLPTVLIRLPSYLTATALLTARPPVVSRTREHATLLDLRTVPRENDLELLDAVCGVGLGGQLDGPPRRG